MNLTRIIDHLQSNANHSHLHLHLASDGTIDTPFVATNYLSKIEKSHEKIA